MALAHDRPKLPTASMARRLAVPLLVGVLVDGASELLKGVAHHQREEFEFLNLHEVPSSLILWLLAIALLVFSVLLLEKFSDPNPSTCSS